MTIFGRSSHCLQPFSQQMASRARALLGALLFTGCSSTLPVVPTGVHPPALAPEQLAVDSEPPPVQVSEIPPQPRKECRWLDGHWQSDGREWRWVGGAWVLSPSGCFYAPASAVWTPLSANKTELFYTPPAWYRHDGVARCQSPPSPC